MLFAPLKIGNGKIELQHRVVLAPLTRNRGVPLSEDTSETINRIWYPDNLVATYYAQRASKGGLLISEGIAPNLEACEELIIFKRQTDSTKREMVSLLFPASSIKIISLVGVK